MIKDIATLSCEFSYSHYIDTLQNAKKHYEFYVPKDVETKAESEYIILRHDVDFSLSKALTMAKIDKNMDTKSTFFLQLHSPWYNLLSLEEYPIVKELQHLEREIGLHYDLDFYEKNRLNSTKALANEIKILEDVLGAEVNCVSSHLTTSSPSPSIPDSIFDASSPIFTVESKYISDSAQSWREACFCQVIGKYPRLQINIHPLWWGTNAAPRESIIRLGTEDKVKQILGRKDRWLQFFECLTHRSLTDEEKIHKQKQLRPI